jgi:hypothetical protein
MLELEVESVFVCVKITEEKKDVDTKESKRQRNESDGKNQSYCNLQLKTSSSLNLR